MKGINFKLITQYYLIFWTPISILFLILIYFTITLLNYPIKSEIRLPEEYKLFLDLIQKADKITTPQKKIEAVFKENPFVEPFPIVQKPLIHKESKREQILKLTTIISHDKKTCIINQKLYREGDTIGATKIVKIGDYYVELLLPSKKKVRMEVGSTYSFME